MLKKKISKEVEHGYIDPEGEVTNFTGFFDVPKRFYGIKIVYHARECGLNDALWAPYFLLPTAESASQTIDFHT
eukprot:3007474-Ditylum_brightwellii.AAC.1